jgi:hypothetical protein
MDRVNKEEHRWVNHQGQHTATSGNAETLRNGPRKETSSIVFASAFSGSNCSMLGSCKGSLH